MHAADSATELMFAHLRRTGYVEVVAPPTRTNSTTAPRNVRFVGGNHLTAGKDCERRFQVPYVVRQRRRARRNQKSQEAHDSTSAEPLPLKSATSRRSRSSEARGNRYRVLAEDNSPSPDRASSKDKGRSVSRGRKGSKPRSCSNGRSQSRSRSRSTGRSSSRSRRLSVSIQEPAEQGTGPTWADRVKGQTKKVTGGHSARA
ncbi:hypothetical protein MTO96_048745 [Rhipicephalus appendiculatus]